MCAKLTKRNTMKAKTKNALRTVKIARSRPVQKKKKQQ